MKVISLKNNIINFLLLIISLSIIYSFGTFYGSKTGQVLSLLVIFFSLICLWIINPLMIISKKVLLYFIFYVFDALILMIRSSFSSYSVLMLGLAFPICIWLTYFLLQKNMFKKFIFIFNNVVAVIAIVSMIFWFFGSILHVINATSTVYSNWSSGFVNSYYNIYFEPQNANRNLFGLQIGVRNSAIFFESTLATFIFGCALISNDLFIKKIRYRIIFLLAIITTTNTTSVFLLLLYILYLILNNMESKYKVLLIFLRIVIGIIIIALLVQVMQSKKGDGISYQVRSNHMMDELKAFIASPFYGQGFNSLTKGSSNSICALAADGGILLWGVYYFPLIWLLKRIPKDKMMLLIIFMVIFSITVVQYTYLVYMIISFVWIILLDGAPSIYEDLLNTKYKKR
jgi:hypothetical protein